MDENTIEMHVLEYINGGLAADREDALRALLQKHGYEIDELNQLRAIYKRLDDVHLPQPGEKMTDDFYRMLKAHKRERTGRPGLSENLIIRWNGFNYQKFMVRIACCLLLLLLGWLIGSSQTPDERYEERLDLMSSEIREMKGMMTLALLNQSSAHERMRAIHQIGTSGNVDERMIVLLLDTLGRDANANVRLVALEALAAHADVPGAREGLIQSMDRQKSPLVQLALADVLVRLDAKQAVGHFRRLLQRKDLNDVVRAKINDSLKMLM